MFNCLRGERNVAFNIKNFLHSWRLYEWIQISGDDSQCIGLVQRKPGRGDTTLSVSCSDKIARWNVVGVQGASCDRTIIVAVFNFINSMLQRIWLGNI